MSVPSAPPFSIAHVFDAPLDQVYTLHTDRAHLTRWLSPPGFRCIHATMSLQPGGRFHYGMEGPRGAPTWVLRVFGEIAPRARLTYLRAFSDPQGGLAHHPMAPTWPLQMAVTEVFEGAGAGQTRVSVTWQPHESDELGNATFEHGRAGMKEGLTDTFRQLEAYLAELKKAA